MTGFQYQFKSNALLLTVFEHLCDCVAYSVHRIELYASASLGLHAWGSTGLCLASLGGIFVFSRDIGPARTARAHFEALPL